MIVIIIFFLFSFRINSCLVEAGKFELNLCKLRFHDFADTSFDISQTERIQFHADSFVSGVNWSIIDICGMLFVHEAVTQQYSALYFLVLVVNDRNPFRSLVNDRHAKSEIGYSLPVLGFL